MINLPTYARDSTPSWNSNLGFSTSLWLMGWIVTSQSKRKTVASACYFVVALSTKLSLVPDLLTAFEPSYFYSLPPFYSPLCLFLPHFFFHSFSLLSRPPDHFPGTPKHRRGVSARLFHLSPPQDDRCSHDPRRSLEGRESHPCHHALTRRRTRDPGHFFAASSIVTLRYT